jgi:hypothetical protein
MDAQFVGIDVLFSCNRNCPTHATLSKSETRVLPDFDNIIGVRTYLDTSTTIHHIKEWKLPALFAEDNQNLLSRRLWGALYRISQTIDFLDDGGMDY